MAKTTNSTRFFKILHQTDLLQRLKIPNKFTRRLSLSNPVLIKPPDGTKWKVCWKYIKGEIWFEKGWKKFTQNYSLGVGSLVVFKYEEGTSIFNVLMFGMSGVEIDYGSSCHTHDDENENVDHSSDDESVEISDDEKDDINDDESVEILDEKEDINVDHSDDESVEILGLNRKKKKKRNRQSSPLGSPRPHNKKVRGEIDKTTKRTSSLNWPKEAKAQEVAAKFISSNPFFTVLMEHNRLVQGQLFVTCLKDVFENEEKYVKLQIGKRSWNVKLLPYCGRKCRRFTAGWPLFASESGLKSGDVCVFELINKNDLVFKVHVF